MPTGAGEGQSGAHVSHLVRTLLGRPPGPAEGAVDGLGDELELVELLPRDPEHRDCRFAGPLERLRLRTAPYGHERGSRPIPPER